MTRAHRTSLAVSLGLIAALTLGFGAYLVLLSPIQEHRSQVVSYINLRNALALGTAPVAAPVSARTPVALLQIPSLGLSQVVSEGTDAGTLMAGPGHLPSSVFPGQSGTSFVFGRRAAFGAPFQAIGRLSTRQLKAIYTCTARTWNKVGGRSTGVIKPLLPQTGSGTRAFFLSAIGITDAQVGSCVRQGIQENSQLPIAGDPNKLAPFSAARFAYFENHAVRLSVRLNDTNGTIPLTNSTVAGKRVVIVSGRYTPVFSRSVFNVVKRVHNGVPAKYATLFGAKGYICTNSTAIGTVKLQGFLPNCKALTH